MEELIVQVSGMMRAVTEAVFYFRRQNHAKGYTISKRVLALGEAYFEKAVQVGFSDSVELLLPIWKSLLEATEAGDEVLLADIYELQLLVALYDIQNCLVENSSGEPKSYWDANMAVLEKKDAKLYQILKNAKESSEREYAFFWANTGEPALSVVTQKGRVQMNTAINPWQEALAFAEESVTANCSKYLVMGFGLGYHVEAMAQLLACRELTVVENDLEQLRIAVMYRDLATLLANDKVNIVYCKDATDYNKWLTKVNQDTECVMWYPSVKTIANDRLRESLENYWVSSNSVKNFGVLLDDNFAKNMKKNDENVDTLKDDFKGKNMVLIAAGPSLDENVEQLKGIHDRDDVKIVCVGKVAAKLLKEDIKPDYIVVTDAMERTKWQISGIEESGVPLIYLSTAASSVVEQYKGKRFIAYQQDYEPAEEAAKEQAATLYQSGGSVTTFALDMGIRMDCKKIICVGVDMGYIGERAHAKGIKSRKIDKKMLRQVEGVGGKTVYTSKTLDMYRLWMEQRIAKEGKTKFVNASNGARIHGMKEKDLLVALD